MEKEKENLFVEKFRLLNSQQHNDEIYWSSSCSSDYEDTSVNVKSCYQIIKKRNMKRKRKKKMPDNISNLNITMLDTSRESKKTNHNRKSPILGCRSRQKSASLSPILKPLQPFQKNNAASSPILQSKFISHKSPILVSKTASPKSAVKVRKKLFNIDPNKNKINSENQNNIKQRDSTDTSILNKTDGDATKQSDIILCQSIKLDEFEENNSIYSNIPKAKLHLVKRVKSFFDSHFSSENTSLSSQNSISDILTPKNSTKTSDEIEMFTCKTQVASNNNSIQSKHDSSANSSESSIYNFNRNSKKIRYKKDGLAYRLNDLLKKQNASLSLWQHERFLAANSNFVIPKGEFTTFRIQKVNFKYGCHLLEVVDVNNDQFLILINSCYVSGNIVSDTVIKLYDPYKIVQYDDNCKLILNITKFECTKMLPYDK